MSPIKHGLSPARISQLRKPFCHPWRAFGGELPDPAASSAPQQRLSKEEPSARPAGQRSRLDAGVRGGRLAGRHPPGRILPAQVPVRLGGCLQINREVSVEGEKTTIPFPAAHNCHTVLATSPPAPTSGPLITPLVRRTSHR